MPNDEQSLVTLQCDGKGVHVDQHLGGVGRAGTAGLGVDDGYLVPSLGDQVGLACQHGAAAADAEGVLPFAQYRVALLFPTLTLLVQQGGVVQEPAGLVEVEGNRLLLQPSYWALKQVAHSQKLSSESSRGRHVTHK